MNYLKAGIRTSGSNRIFGRISRCTGILPLLLLLAAGTAQAKPDVTFVDQTGLAAVDIPATFAQVFAPGDVPAGLSVTVNVGGNPLPTQVDDKAVHPDGSLRHAVITTRLPTLGAGQSLAAEIVTSDPAVNGPAVSAAELLATPFDTVIELTLDGAVYTASARDALLADSSRRWLEGPLVTEFMLRRAFATADGSMHPHLMARFDVRAYQGLESVRVDVIVENNWTYVPDPRNFTYDVRVLVGGAEVYSLSRLTHYRHARWHKVFWWGKEPGIYTRHDTRYLQATQAVPHYDPELTIPEDVLEEQGQVQYTPMSNVEINDYMPEAGADKGIGPLPRWAARYLISGDPRAYHGVLANGDAGGSYAAHYRDIDTDLPVSLDDYPYVTGDKRQYPKDHIVALCETDCASPLTRDTAHQPSIAFLPYLLTGDHYYLEELLFWANGNLISSSIGTREGSKGLLRGQQVRGQAWSLRTLAQAAYITPDAHPMKAYFNEKLQNNIDYYLDLYANNPAANKLGALPHHNDLDTAAPWMDDFFTWAVGYTVELGYSDFLPMLAWKSKYPVGRMASPGDEFCWIFGGVYQLAIGVAGDKTDPANWFQSLNEVYLNNFGNRQNSDGVYVRDMPCAGQEMADWLADFDRNRSSYLPGEMYGYSDSPVGYPANLQPALAVAVDHGIANAGLAWQRLIDRAKFPDYSSNPQFAVTPRSLAADYSGPLVSFSASAITVDPGNSGVTLSWQASGADNCTASGDWSGEQGVSGSFETGAIHADAIYTLNCSGAGGSTLRSVMVSFNGGTSSAPNGSPAEQTSGGGAFGPWPLLILAVMAAWGRLRERTTRRCHATGALVKGMAVACALAVVPAQAAVPGLVLHWDFDTASGTTIGDASGSGNDGNSANTPVLVPGKLGQAMRFDDVARDTVGLAVGNFPGEEFSLSLWLRSSDSNGGSTLVSYRSNDRKTPSFKLWGINNLQVMVNGDHVKDTGVAVGDGQWHHLAVNWARRNGVLTLYKDGVRVFQAVDVSRTRALASSGFLNAGVDVQKWSTDWGNAYGGDMDDLRIYNRLLSEDEISWLASATPLSDTQPPAPVSGFQAVAVSPREAYLRWETPADNRFVAGYRVYRGGVLAGTTGDTTFLDEGMTPGASHRYTVVAFDGAGNDAAASQTVTVQAPASGSVLDALPPGHWYEIKDSSVWTQLGVNPDVMGSWSGGIYDSKRERLVIWGGGHMNYDGNELYGFDFNTFSWSQLTPITPRDQRTRSVDVYADGLPSSRHTYNGLQYIPTIDRFFSSGGALYGSGGCSGGTWLYDFDAVPAGSGWQNIADDKGGCAMISAYDPITGYVWYSAGRELFTFDPLNLSAPWTRRLSNMVFDFYMSAAIDPTRRKLVLLGGTGYGGVPKTVVYDITDPAAVTGGVASTRGATEIENSDAAGFEFDPVSDRFVAWNGGDQVYTLTPDTLNWSRMAPAATNLITPSAPAGMGTYGRFRYIPSKNVFVVVNDMEQNVFVYKLSEGSGSSRPFPSLEFTAGSTSVSAGSTVDLVWAATDADGCTASGGWSGNKAVAGSETVGPLSESTSFILRCSSEVGDAVRQVEVAVSAGVPSVSLEGNTSSILAGETLTLSWSSLNTDTCTAGGDWSGTRATSGSQVVTPDSDSSYSLTCTGSGGSASASFEVSVSVTSDPIVSINADERNLVAGSSTILRWSSANVDSCVASGAWSGPRATSGSQPITPDNDSTYSLSCTGRSGSVASSVKIIVAAAVTEPSGRGGAGGWDGWGLGAMLLLLLARLAARRQRLALAG